MCTFATNNVTFLCHHNTPKRVNPLSEKGKPKDLKLGPLQKAAFCNTKNALSTVVPLTSPMPLAPLLLSTDANDIAICTGLEQVVIGLPCQLAFFSRKLSKVKSGYSTFDGKLLAVQSALCHFRQFLEGTPSIIHMHHMPLVHSFIQQFDAWSTSQH
ncbi:uncharacterized protein [Palaemon carinicauda]|uniref:uncharacterized protein n=1 Tax=Palaemon carinicauda TaxID=392227 RepID=UPI0035B617C3